MKAAAPRGVLRTAILHQASLGMISGVDFSEWVEKTTDGLWKPSPGSIYFLLNELESQGYIRTIKREDRRYYIATEKGREELRGLKKESSNQFRRQFAALILEATVMESPIRAEIKRLLKEAASIGLQDKDK